MTDSNLSLKNTSEPTHLIESPEALKDLGEAALNTDTTGTPSKDVQRPPQAPKTTENAGRSTSFNLKSFILGAVLAGILSVGVYFAIDFYMASRFKNYDFQTDHTNDLKQSLPLLKAFDVASVDQNTIYLHNGATITNVGFGLNYFGRLVSPQAPQAPLFIFSSKTCENCDEPALLRLYAGGNGQLETFYMPGPILSPDRSQILSQMRVFFGRCIDFTFLSSVAGLGLKELKDMVVMTEEHPETKAVLRASLSGLTPEGIFQYSNLDAGQIGALNLPTALVDAIEKGSCQEIIK